ncbi:MAG TPA: IS91 family transposase [Polyangiaceae bacterium]
MLKLADVVRRHGPAYMERFGDSMLPSHVRALEAIVHCRTPVLGGQVTECTQCGREHLLYHSCRNRACPQCGYDAATRWLSKQRDLLLPVPYFHVVFTLPSELRRIVRSHQRPLLAALFRAAFDSLASLCADPHFLGAEMIGALAVLHTWTRTLEWHPHVHLLVPGGGLAPDGCTWLSVPRRRQRFIVPVEALAERFRGRFLHLARRALPGVAFPDIPWEKRWVVFAKPVVHGNDQVLEYLGRYVHRTAIGERALIALDDRTVTFRYRDSRDYQRKTMTLPGQEFLRRFLQHVPAKGFHRVRAFGLLHPEHRHTLRRLQLLLAPPRAPEPALPEPALPATTRSRLTCPHCGKPSLRLVRRLSAAECIARDNAARAAPPGTARAPPLLPSSLMRAAHP